MDIALGSRLIRSERVLSVQDLEQFEALFSEVPESEISNGDDKDIKIYVRRLIHCHPGEKPAPTLPIVAAKVLSILSGVLERLSVPDCAEYNVRRCQHHRLPSMGSIGLHVDKESDPANEFALIVQLSSDYEGGDFIVHHPTEGKQTFSTVRGDILITPCSLPHEVKTVVQGERQTLNFFMSRSSGPNVRDPQEACTRPNCKWCGDHLKSNLS